MFLCSLYSFVCGVFHWLYGIYCLFLMCQQTKVTYRITPCLAAYCVRMGLERESDRAPEALLEG